MNLGLYGFNVLIYKDKNTVLVGSPDVSLDISNPPPWSSLLCACIKTWRMMMSNVSQTLTICFLDPFWVGFLYRTMQHQGEVCKITFGKEPSDQEVYEFLSTRYNQLHFVPSEPEVDDQLKLNPKRKQREARKSLEKNTTITKSMKAIKAQQELKKVEHVACAKAQKKQQEQERFLLKQQKKKAKHRGR